MSLIVNAIKTDSTEVLKSALIAIGIQDAEKHLRHSMHVFHISSVCPPFNTITEKTSFMQGWRRVLDSWNDLPEETKLICCAIALSIFEDLSEDIKIAGMSIPKSKNEAAIRAFGACYYHGRRIINNRSLRDRARLAIEESFQFSEYVSDSASSPERLKRFKGQLGVGKLFLARGRSSEKPIQLFESALSDLEASRVLGDETPNHYAYELETIARILSIKHDAKIEEKGFIISENVPIVIEQQAYAVGDFYLSCGIRKTEQEGFCLSEVQDFLNKSIKAYTEGIAICHNVGKESGQYIAKRGYAKLRLKTICHAEDSLTELNSIVSDLEFAKPNYHTGFNPLPTALFWRAQYYQDSDRFDEAINDLEKALLVSPPKTDEPEIFEQIQRTKLALASCKLQRAIRTNSVSDAIRYIKEIMLFDSRFDPSIPLIANAIKYISEIDQIKQNKQLVRECIEKMINIRERPHCVGETRAFASSYIAGALLRLRGDLTMEELRLACRLYAQAEDVRDTEVAPEQYGLTGEAKLRLAKLLRNSGDNTSEPRHLFVEACSYFEKSANLYGDTIDLDTKKTLYSKLGESYLRLHQYTHNASHIESCIRFLESSLELGNEEPELYGLLGDAYYRLGGSRSNAKMLEKALYLKNQAATLFQSSHHIHQPLRENYSLTSKINFMLWRLDGDNSRLVNAITFATKAAIDDPGWPWPYFQLADYCQNTNATQRMVAFDDAIEDLEGHNLQELGQALRNQNFEALNAIGSRAAVQNTEFGKSILGGRLRSVYLLDDPHRLLSNSIVLKRGEKKDVDRDSNYTDAFAEYLSSTNAPSIFKTPKRLGVISQGDQSVYVMTLEKGNDFGSFILDDFGSGNESQNCGLLAAQLLGYFHSWAWTVGEAKIGSTEKIILRVFQRAGDWFKRSGIQPFLADKLGSFSKGLSNPRQLLLLKKDAHPENWIVGFDNTITIFDFENSALLPILFDLCQLVDDYPLAKFDLNGINFRKLAIEKYLSTIYGLTPEIKDEVGDSDVEHIYYSNLVARTAFGMGRIMLKLVGESDVSSSALKGNMQRMRHYVNAATWLSTRYEDEAIGKAARLLLEIYGQSQLSMQIDG